jgi:hypothetical protein
MGVRRQIYLDEADDRLLEAESGKTGLSVSALIRRAIQHCYGPGRRLSWDEVFQSASEVNSANGEEWIYDALFDAETIDQSDRPAVAGES